MKKAHVLIIDDNKKNLKVLENFLKKHDILITMAESGNQALEYINSELPDLILLDILMPEMDGFKICKSIKNEERTRDIPIIFLSALSNLEHKIEGFKMGGVDYITKPFNQEEVVARVNIHLQIRRQQLELEELNRMKDKFFSIMAHDLKNPIGSFKQVTKLLVTQYDELSENDRREFIELIDDSAKSMFELLENLLTWSRSQRGILLFEPEIHDISQIINNILPLIKIQAENKNIELISEVQDNTIGYFDINMIQTVIRNLLSNAVKFTHKGGNITISSSYIKDFLKISVKDTGTGIDDKIKNSIFRLDVSCTTLGTSQEKGTGLGLILCKEFIVKHNGEIWVDSVFGEGSTFNFTVPKK